MRAIRQFENDMEVSKQNAMYEDYAYAEGARNAYEVMLNKLQKGEN
jgi:hypothetical protein